MFDRIWQSPSLRSMRHRAFRRMAVANLVSVTGTWMQTIAQSWVVLQLTGSTAALGASVALQAGPAVVLGLWGGAVVDRTDKRRTLIATQTVLAGLAAALALLSTSGTLTVFGVCALALAGGVVRVLDGPATATFGAQMVEPDELANATALGSIIASAGRILGMSLGGVVIATAGPNAVFWFNAVSFAGVALTLLTLRAADLRPLETASPEHSGVRQGLAYLLTQPALVTLLALSFFLASFGRNFQVTMAAMTDTVFGLGPDAYGVVSTALAIGGLGGAAIATRMGRPAVRTILACAAGLGAVQVVSGATPGLGTFTAVIGLIGAIAVVLDTLLATHTQLAVPEMLRGRVLAVFSMVSMAGVTVGAPALGVLADGLGARAALIIGGLVAGGATVAAAAALGGNAVRGVPVPATISPPAPASVR